MIEIQELEYDKWHSDSTSSTEEMTEQDEGWETIYSCETYKGAVKFFINYLNQIEATQSLYRIKET